MYDQLGEPPRDALHREPAVLVGVGLDRAGLGTQLGVNDLQSKTFPFARTQSTAPHVTYAFIYMATLRTLSSPETFQARSVAIKR